jgi:metal-responsive CopG/Arc/MetJ family transcriptional regulator
METIQVVLDAELLRATDGAARRARVNRSALIHRALREHLKRLATLEIEARDRRGYDRHPEASAEVAAWEREAAWPER